MQRIRTFFEQFIRFAPEEWEAMESKFHRVPVRNKEIILEAGEKCDFVGFVDEGLFRFYQLKDSTEKVTAFWFPGEFLSNYRSFVSGQPSIHFIESMAKGSVWKMHKKDLYALYDQYPNIERLGRLMAEQLYVMVAHRLDNFQRNTPEERYLRLLQKDSRLIQEIPQYMLASYLGVSPESLSRIRKRITL